MKIQFQFNESSISMQRNSFNEEIKSRFKESIYSYSYYILFWFCLRSKKTSLMAQRTFRRQNLLILGGMVKERATNKSKTEFISDWQHTQRSVTA